METREATVSKIRSRNDSGWTVLVVDDHDCPAWVGVIEEDIQYGDTIKAAGSYVVHERFGQQFKMEQVISILPKSTDGKLAWLASELPGIGPERARTLVDTFGDNLWNVLSLNSPELAAIPGIGAIKAAEISKTYLSVQDSKDVVPKLVDLGLSVADARRIWKELRHNTLPTLEEDPYDLMEVPRISFEKADMVARRLGLDSGDVRRARGYGRHLLSEEAGKGHCFADARSLFQTLDTICANSEEAIRSSKRFVVDEEGRVWLKAYHTAEIEIAGWIND